MGEKGLRFLKNIGRTFTDQYKDKDELSINRRYIALTICMGGVHGNLVIGNFLTGMLLLMQADDAFMGMITMITLVGNILQVFSPLFLERFEQRKNILIFGKFLMNIFNIIIIGMLPYIHTQNQFKLTLVMVATLSVSLINAFTSPGFAAWHLKSIPNEVRPGFYTFVNITCNGAIFAALLGASFIVDRYKADGLELQGLTIIRVIAFALSFLDMYALLKIKEYPYVRTGEKLSITSVLIRPFRNKRYMLTVAISCVWFFGVNIIGPYYSVYLIKDLKVDYSFLNIIGALNVPILILGTPLWRKVVEKLWWFKSLYVIMILYPLSYIGLAFVNKDSLYLYAIFSVYQFLITAGVGLVTANLAFVGLPEGDQTNYLGFFSTVVTLAQLLGIGFGKEFILRTQNLNLNLFGIQMQNKQYIMLLAAAMIFIGVGVVKVLLNKVESTKDSVENKNINNQMSDFVES